MRLRSPALVLTAVLGVLGLAACSGGSEGAAEPDAVDTATSDVSEEPTPTSPTTPTTPTTSSPPEPSEAPEPPDSMDGAWGPVSLPALAQREIRGDRLRFGEVREDTASYVSRQVTYRVRAGDRSLRISGVLNVPKGRGPFPTVVLAHGYIDPAYYVSGQGMTRERGYLADRGYVALHVDYRNHAFSDDDPANDRRTRLGYVEDVVAAAQALRTSGRVPVDDERVYLMGRSMGGGVALRTLVSKPGAFDGAVAWASVSSSEPENLDQFLRDDPGDSSVLRQIEEAQGLPGQPGSRRFWRGVSARTFFDQVEDPVLLIHGGSDDTCPPRWARDSHRLLREAGAPARLAWYADEEHAFGPRFNAAMDRSIAFFERVARDG